MDGAEIARARTTCQDFVSALHDVHGGAEEMVAVYWQQHTSACNYSGWVAKWTEARGARCGYLRSAPCPAGAAPTTAIATATWQVLHSVTMTEPSRIEGLMTGLCDCHVPDMNLHICTPLGNLSAS